MKASHPVSTVRRTSARRRRDRRGRSSDARTPAAHARGQRAKSRSSNGRRVGADIAPSISESTSLKDSELAQDRRPVEVDLLADEPVGFEVEDAREREIDTSPGRRNSGPWTIVCSSHSQLTDDRVVGVVQLLDVAMDIGEARHQVLQELPYGRLAIAQFAVDL